MELLSIGEFARMSQLSPKALRLYDDLELLLPFRVDPNSGYRLYAPEQLGQARLVAIMRQIGVPLAQIKLMIELEPTAAAEQIAAYWVKVEASHGARRELAGYLVDRLNGKRSMMYEVATRIMPARNLLCLERYVEGEQGVWSSGKEFVAIFRERSFPHMEGRAGAAFLVYHGEVNDDSDGPIEWCRPVPDGRTDELAAQFTELVVRTEPAHEEAFVSLGRGETNASEWQLIAESLRTWASEQNRRPSELGVRVTFLANTPRDANSAPDRDFAIPLR